MILSPIIIFVSLILKTLYGYEAVNLLLRILPSKFIVLILKKNGATLGVGIRIQSPFLIHNADQTEPIYSNLRIGDDCYIGRDCIFDLMGNITIGNHVTISHRAILNTHTNAGKSPLSKTTFKPTVGSINIKDGAYLGTNVTVLESTTIGKQSIIGSCSLVNKDIQSGATAFGVPCKVYKKNI